MTNATQAGPNRLSADEIKSRYQVLRQETPHIRARNAADAIGISEAELVAARVGDGVTQLNNNAEAILKDVVSLGAVMALSRNEYCVHERHGVYDNSDFFQHGEARTGLFLNPDIDLRLFMNHWAYAFAVMEDSKAGVRKSLQFFDKEGQAIHKIYLTDRSQEAAFDALVVTHRADVQTAEIPVQPYPPKQADLQDHEIDWPGFRAAWERLRDTHDFFPMLKKFKVGRTQALNGIGDDFALTVDNGAARRVLEAARDRQCEIMVFVGNRGCVQIHTGKVNKLLQHGPWFNVLDPDFNLHLNVENIAESWVTRKPTEDGIVTALEIFDADGELIVTFFGKRKPGEPELDLWRDIVSDLTAEGLGDAA